MARQSRMVKKVPTEVVRSFARRVREARRERGVSQMALAVKAQVHISYLGRLERAQCSPTLDTVANIAKALGVSPGALVTDDPETADILPALRQQAREAAERALRRADRPALQALAVVASALARGN